MDKILTSEEFDKVAERTIKLRKWQKVANSEATKKRLGVLIDTLDERLEEYNDRR